MKKIFHSVIRTILALMLLGGGILLIYLGTCWRQFVPDIEASSLLVSLLYVAGAGMAFGGIYYISPIACLCLYGATTTMTRRERKELLDDIKELKSSYLW